MEENLLSIHEAAKKLKVSTKTLRRWETKGILVPSRTAGAHRRYTLAQITEFAQKLKTDKSITRGESVEKGGINLSEKIGFAPSEIRQKFLSKITPSTTYETEKNEQISTQISEGFETVSTAVKTTNNFGSKLSSVRASFRLAHKQRIVFFGSVTVLSVLVFMAGTLYISRPVLNSFFSSQSESIASDLSDLPVAQAEAISGAQVLAGQIASPSFKLNFAAQSTFEQDTNFLQQIQVAGLSTLNGGIVTNDADINAGTGELTASNVIYSITAGQGISITPGQNPVISSTAVGTTYTAGSGISIAGNVITNTSQAGNSFGKINVGSDVISAGGQDSTFTLAAGSGITLSANTGTSTITINSSGGVTSPWEDDGAGTVSLVDTANDVLIGAGTPLFKLTVEGDIGPTTGATYNLGSLSEGFNGIYGETFYAGGQTGATVGTASCVTTVGGIVVGTGTCQLGSEQWVVSNGMIYTGIPTLDFALGGTSTDSAKFSVLNIAAGTPVASISANNGGGATSLSGSGTLTTTNKQTITIGSATSGNVQLFGFNAGIIHSNSNGILSSAAVNLNGGPNEITGLLQPENGGTGIDTSGASGVPTISSGVWSVATQLPTTLGGLGADVTAAGAGEIIYSTTANTYATLAAGNTGECLVSNGASAPSWTSCTSGITGSPFKVLNGAIVTINQTEDLLVGGVSSDAAKFAFVNVNSGVPTASISAGTTGNNLYITGDGTIGTTNKQTLTIGSPSTGNIVIGGNIILGNLGTGVVHSTNGTLSTGPVTNAELQNSTITVTNGTGIGVSGSPVALGGAVTITNTGVTSNIAGNGISVDQSTGAVTITNTGVLTATAGTGISIDQASGDITISNDGVLSIAGGTGGSAISGALTLANSTTAGSTITIDNAAADGTTKGIAAFNSTNFQASSGVINTIQDINTSATPTFAGLTLSGFTTNGGLIYTNGSGVLAQTAAGIAGQCLISNGGGAPVWTDCSSAANNYWTQANGALYPTNTSVDMFIGGNSTSSAKFAFINVNSGTPTASISAGTAGNNTYLTGDGTIATTNKQTLTLGSSSTGNVAVFGLGTGVVHSTNGILSTGLVTNAELQNSSITVNGGTGLGVSGSPVSLGGTLTLSNTGVTSNIAGTGISLDQSTGAVTITNTGVLSVQGGTGGSAISGALTLANSTTSGSTITIDNAAADGATKGIAAFNSTNFSAASGVINTIQNINTSATPTFAGLTLSTFTSNGGVIYANGSGVLAQTAAGTSSQCLIGGTTPTWSDCGAAAGSYWTLANGAIFPTNTSVDLFVGGNATSAAKFAFINVNSGTPTASISAGTANNNTFLTGAGNLGTTNAQTLTLGGLTTGNISINPAGGAGALNFNVGSLSINGQAGITQGTAACVTTVNGIVVGTGTCQLGSEQWSIANGMIYTGIPTLDFALGGNSTASAKFAVLNMAAGIPTASISAGTTGNNTYLTGDGTLATTNNQTLTLGSSSTGNIVAFGIGTGVVHANNGALSTGVVTNAELQNSTITVNNGSGIGVSGSPVALGGTVTISNTGVLSIAGGTGGSAIAGALTLANSTTAGSAITIDDAAADGATKGIAAFNSTNFQASSGVINTIQDINTSATPTFAGLTLSGFTTNGGVLFTNGSGVLAQTTAGTNTQCLIGGTTPTWGSCSTGTTNSPFTELNGAIVPLNSTEDLLVGGQSSASAKFAFINVNNGVPTASISGTTTGTNAFLTGDGNLGTTNKQSLTLGGSTTGNILLNPLNGTGKVGVNVAPTQGVLEVAGNQAGGDVVGLYLRNNAADQAGNRISLSFGASADSQVGQAKITAIRTGSGTGDLAFYTYDTGMNEKLRITSGGNVGIGDTSPASLLTVGNGDLFQVNSSGAIAAATGITSSGTIQFSGFTTNGGVLYTNGSGVLAQTTAGTNTQCLIGGTTPTWADCSSAASNYWTLANGSIFPTNTSVDLFVGGNATTSAKFAFTGVNSGTPTASISAGTTGNNTYLTGNGTLATTNKQTLTLGSSTTGNVAVFGLGTGVVHSTGGVLSTGLVTNAELQNSSITVNNGTGIGVSGSPVALGGAITISNTGVTSNIAGNGISLDQSTGAVTITNTGVLSIAGGTGGSAISGALTLANSTTAGSAITIDDAAADGATKGIAAFNSTNFSAAGGVINTIQNINTAATPTFAGLTLSGFTTNGGVLYTNGSGVLAQTTAGTNTQCLIGGTTPTWADCSSSANNYWTLANGAVFPTNTSIDLFVGGNATSAAKFAFIGVNSGTPTASISAGTTGNNTYLTGDGNLATTNKQTLTLGSATTGNVAVFGLGTGVVHSTGGVLSTGLVTNAELQNSSITVNNGTGISVSGSPVSLGGAITITNDGVTSLTGTPNQVNVSGSTGAVTLSLPQDIDTGATPTFAGLTLSGFTTNGGVLFTNGSGVLAQTSAGTNTQCLVGGTTPTWADCGAAANNYWTLANGSIFPTNTSVDLLIGGNSTASAKFALVNVNNGTPTASISAGTVGNNLFITGAGNLATTNMQTLTLGGSTTGDILLSPRNGSGTTTANGNLTVTGNTILGDSNTTDTLTQNLLTSTFNSGVTTGTAYSVTSSTLSTGTLFSVSNTNVTGGSGTLAKFASDKLTDGTLLNVTRNAGASANQFTGNLITGSFDQTFTGGSFNQTGHILNLTRSNTMNNAGQTLTISGALATLSSSDTETAGDIADTSNILSLAQNCGAGVSCTGAVLNIVNSGTGVAIQLPATNGTASGLQFGTDANLVNLYRSANDTLKTDDSFIAAGSTIQFSTFTTNGGVLFTNGSGVLAQTAAGSSSQCLIGGTTPSWGSCATGNTDSPFTVLNGAVVPLNQTVDLLIGGVSTSAAKFAFINVAGGVPTASISAGTTGNNAFLTGTGNLATTSMQSLTLGGSTTGNIVLNNGAFGAATGNNAALYAAAGTGAITSVSTNTVGLCLVSGASGPTWGVCQNAPDVFWNQTSGVLYPNSSTVDIAFGGQTSASAKFTFINVNSGIPTASISAGTTGNNTFLTGAGNLATTNMQTLTLGGSTTGNISLLNNTSITGNLTPSSDDTYDLGSDSLRFKDLYLGGETLHIGTTTGDEGTLSYTTSSNTLSLDGAGPITIGNTTATGITLGRSGQSLTFPAFTTNGGLLYTNGSGVLAQTAAGTSTQCLIGGTTPSWGSCATGNTDSPFTSLNGAIVPLNQTQDLLLGGVSTAAAKFAFIGVNSGIPTASISAGTTGNNTYLTGDGNLATTNKQTLTLGSSTTGNVAVFGLGTGVVHSTGGVLSTGLVTNAELQNSSITVNNGTGIGVSGSPVALGGAITISNTGVTSNIAGNGISLDQSTGAVTITNTGVLSIAGGTGGSAISGALTLANSTTAGSAITIDDAAADGATKGIAAFNSTNFSAASGIINTIQNINTAATPTFAGLTLSTLTNAGGVLYTNGSGVIAQTSTGTATQCLIGGATPTWASCSTGGTDSPFTVQNGAIIPLNQTVDLLVGGVSTTAAKFAFINVNSGTPTASISGSVAGVSTYLTGDGVLSTTKNTSLAINPNGGNVGIGTSVPLANLHVLGGALGADIAKFERTSGATAAITINAAGGDPQAVFSTSGANRYSLGYDSSNNSFNLSTGGVVGTNDVIVVKSGNVNIGGDTSPASLFNVGNADQFQVNSSGAIAAATGITSSGTITFSGLNGQNGVIYGTQTTGVLAQATTSTSGLCLVSGASAPAWADCSASSNNLWRVGNGALSPTNNSLDLLIGSNSTSSAKFAITGVNNNAPVATLSGSTGGSYLSAAGTLATTNKQTLNIGATSTGDINIGTDATARNISIGNSTGATALNFTSGTGVQTFTSGATTGTAFSFAGNSVTSGTGLLLSGNALTGGSLASLTSSSTALTGTAGIGSLLNLDWSPGSATTATGDLLSLNIGSNGTTTGNLFNILDSGSSLFAVSETAVTSNLPASFNAAGDTSFAYDIQFTNPTASYIKSNAPLSITAGKPYNSSNLTLSTYNVGNVIVDSQAFVTNYAATISGQLVAGTQTAPANIGEAYITNSSTFGKALAILNQTESQDILTGSASGTTVFRLDNSGNLKTAAGTTFDTLTSGTLGIGTTNATTLTLGRTGQNITLPAFTTNGGLLYTNGSGVLSQITSQGSSGDCLLSAGAGAAPAFGACPGASATNYWDLASGALAPKNSTVDLFIGGVSTAAAKFAFINVNSGTPTASISGSVAGVNTYLSGNGVLSTTLKTSLAINPNGGNVGIGLSAPEAPLDIQGTTSTGIRLRNSNNPTQTIGDIYMTPFGGLVLSTKNTSATQAFVAIDPENSAYGMLLYDSNTGTTDFSNFYMNNDTTDYLNIVVNAANSTTGLVIQDGGNVGVGDTTPNSLFSVGSTSQFQVNSSGAIAAATGITSSGNITFSAFTTNGGLLYTNGSGVLSQITSQGSSGDCLLSAGAGAAPAFGACPGASATNYWDLANGALAPKNSTVDLFIGGVSTASAKFAVLGVNSTSPTASISAQNGSASALYLDPANNALQSVKNQTLTIGGNTTGAINISPNSGNGVLNLNAVTANLTGTTTLNASSLATLNTASTLAINTTTLTASNLATITSAASLGISATTLTVGNGSAATIRTTTNGLTLDSGNDTLTIAASDTALTASGIATIDFASTVGIDSTTLNLGNGSDATIGTTSNASLALTPNGTGNITLTGDFNSQVLIGATGATTEFPLFVNNSIGNNAVLAVNGTGGGDLITASAAGSTKFNVTNGGSVQLATGQTLDTIGNGTLGIGTVTATTLTLGRSGQGITLPAFGGGGSNANAVLYVNSSNALSQAVTTTSGLCLVSGAANPTWGACDANASQFTSNAGAIVPLNQTMDLLVGGVSSAAAKFAFINVNNGTPTASISAGTTGNNTYLTGLGNLGTTNRQTLTLGGTTTGLIKVLNGSGNSFATFDTVNSGLSLGAAGSIDGLLSLFSSGVGETAPTISANSTGDLSVSAPTGVVNIGNGTSGDITLDPGAGQLYANLSSTGDFQIQDNGVTFAIFDDTAHVGIGTTSPTSALYVTRPLSLGATGKSLAIFDQIENQDILTASKSGTTMFTVNSNGNLQFKGSTNFTTTLTSATGNDVTLTIPDTGTTDTFCLLTLANCGSGASQFTSLNGAIVPLNQTQDLLLGGVSSAAAKFAFINVNNGTPTASISAGTTNNNTFLTGLGNLGTTNRQTLTLGGLSTGLIKVLNTAGNPFATFDTVNNGLSLGASGSINGLLSFFSSGVGETAPTITANSSGDLNLSAPTGIVNIGSGVGDITLDPGANHVGIGTTSPISELHVTRALSNGATGKSLAIFDQIENQDIFSASKSGVTKFTIGANGEVGLGLLAGVPNFGTAGQCLMSGGVGAGASWGTCGGGANYWQINNGLISPFSDTLAFAIGGTSTSSAYFSVDSTQVAANVPVSFNAPGDVSIAYDIQFTNPTASYIKSAAPLQIVAGEVFNSTNLTLQTYNSGNVVVDSQALSILGAATVSGQLSALGQVTVATQLLINGGNNSRIVMNNGDVGSGNGLVFNNASAAEDARIYEANNNTLYIAAGDADDIRIRNNAGTDIFQFNTSNGTFQTIGSQDLTIDTGSSNTINIGSANAGTINIATDGSAQSVNIGTGNQATEVTFFSRTARPAAASFNTNGDFAIGQLGTGTSGGRIWIRASNRTYTFYSNSNTSADYSEYMKQEDTSEPGDVMVLSNDQTQMVKKSSTAYDQNSLGVVSQYGTAYGDGECADDPSCGKSFDPHYAQVGMLGQVYTKVSTENGDIKPGDPLTTSSVTGVAMKATKAGRIIGYALDYFDGSQSGQDLFNLPTYPIHVVEGRNVGKVVILLQAGWYDPSAPPPDGIADIAINSNGGGDYGLVDSNGKAYDNTIVADQLAAGNINVGALKAQEITADNLHINSDVTVEGTLFADKIKANQIEGLEYLVRDSLGNVNPLASGSAQFGELDGRISSISASLENIKQVLESVNFVGFATQSGGLASVDNLMVSGTTTLAEASILNSLSLGNNLTIDGSSINTTGTDLEIQPLAQGNVNFLGGKITFDTLGNMKVEGDAEFAQDVKVGGVLSATDIAVKRVDAAEIISDTEVTATGSSGLITLKAGQTELKVNNNKAKSGSLIFLTPKVETDLPIYIKQQANGYFTIGIKEEQLYNIPVNFLLVN